MRFDLNMALRFELNQNVAITHRMAVFKSILLIKITDID